MPNSARSRLTFTILAAAGVALAAYQSIAATPPRGEPSSMHAANVGSTTAAAGVAPPSTAFPVSEPAILAVFGCGLIATAARLRRRKAENR